MKKFLLATCIALGLLAVLPQRADAACTDSTAQSIINTQTNPSISLAAGGNVTVSEAAPGVSGCNIRALVYLNWVGTCTGGSSSQNVAGGTWCVKDASAATVTATMSMTGQLPCGQSATVYGRIGRADGGQSNYIYSDTVTDSVTRHCNSGSAIYEEDCEDDGQWEWQGNGTCTTLGTPIIVSTGRDKPGLKDYKLTNRQNGVQFDIDGDGVLEQVSWTKQGASVAFLALDRNLNGVIDNGKELFGNVTVPGLTNGFDALAALAGVDVILVNQDVPLYAALLLWTDLNHDGISQPSELRPLSSQFSGVYTVGVPSELEDDHGNKLKFIGLAEELGTKDTRVIYDVFFKRQ